MEGGRGEGLSSKRRPFDIGVPMVPRLSSWCPLPAPASATVPALASALALVLALAQVWLPLCGLRVLKIVKHSTGKLSTDLWPAMELELDWRCCCCCRRCCRCCSQVSYLVACLRLTGPRTGVSGWQRKEHKKG